MVFVDDDSDDDDAERACKFSMLFSRCICKQAYSSGKKAERHWAKIKLLIQMWSEQHKWSRWSIQLFWRQLWEDEWKKTTTNTCTRQNEMHSLRIVSLKRLARYSTTPAVLYEIMIRLHNTHAPCDDHIVHIIITFCQRFQLQENVKYAVDACRTFSTFTACNASHRFRHCAVCVLVTSARMWW